MAGAYAYPECFYFLSGKKAIISCAQDEVLDIFLYVCITVITELQN